MARSNGSRARRHRVAIVGGSFSMTAGMAQGRIGLFDWRALLAAHAASDIVFAVLFVRAHPGIVRDLRAGYET